MLVVVSHLIEAVRPSAPRSRTIFQQRNGRPLRGGSSLRSQLNPILSGFSFGQPSEPYGDHLTHLHGHDKAWERFQRNGIAPIDAEYEELPRGRVMFDTKTCQFRLLADRCILKRKDLVAKIKKEMRLPRNTKVGGDNHYRCFDCLREGLAE